MSALPAPGNDRPAIFVLAYFTTASESLHLAVSVDGRRFVPVDVDRPVLTGTVGACTLRDPFVGLAPDGRFHLVTTDGWSSQKIVHAVSDDLLTWSAQRLLPVMAGVPGALNCWAPEFYYRDDDDTVTLIWSSVVDPHPISGPQRTLGWNERHQAIWSCTTRDFLEFSDPRPFFDPGYSVIDATVLVLPDGLLLAFKDERGDPVPGGVHNRIHLRRKDAEGRWRDLRPAGPSPAEGPALYHCRDEIVLLFDRYTEAGYGAMISSDGRNWAVYDVEFPPGTRHASVVTVDAAHAAVPLLLERAGLGSVRREAQPTDRSAP